MKISQQFPSKWFRAGDLDGQPHQFRISRVEVDDLAGNGKQEDRKPVLYFEGAEKGLGLNKTNAKTISNAFGDETDDWLGNMIELYPTETDYQGERVECIRVRIPKIRPAAQAGATTDTWTLAQAIAECEKYGVSKSEMGGELRRLGRETWLPERDTGTIKDLIAAKRFNNPLSANAVHQLVTEEEIPF